MAQYCRSCHVCQIISKPNQSIPVAPCIPFLPLESRLNRFWLIVLDRSHVPSQVINIFSQLCVQQQDSLKLSLCVRSRSLLFPEFSTVFGLLRVVQSDQGSNFMSRLLFQALKQLSIQHSTSSAYHSEKRGALERFHQTLKTMLKIYCKEFERDWDDGVPLLLFAVRRYGSGIPWFQFSWACVWSYCEGPLKLVKEKWLAFEHLTPTNLLDYVSKFRFRLARACELAKDNLKAAQGKMKTWYDRKARHRVFSSGDQVLVL